MGRSDFQLLRLGGGMLIAYRVLMVALLLLALPGFLYSYDQQRDAMRSVNASFAAGLRFPGGNDRVIRVAPLSDEAHAKGVLPGDQLIAIDGQAVPHFDFDRLQTLLAGPDGSAYRLTVRTGDAPARTLTLTRSARYLDQAYAGSGLSFEQRSWAVFGFETLDAVLALLAALVLFTRRSTDPVAAMLALSAVPLGDGITYLWPNAGYALYCFYALRMMLFLTTLLVFPDGRFFPRWTVWSLPVIAAIGIVSVLSITIEPAIWARQILFFGFIAFAMAAFVLRYRATPQGTQRQQIKFVMLGGVAWVGLGLIGLVLEKLSGASASVAVAAWLSLGSHAASSLAAMALAGGILVSVLRYRLYDADALIGRSATYAFLALLLGATFAASEAIALVMGERFLGADAWIVSIVAGGVIAALLAVPFNQRVRRWTEQRFQKRLTALRDELPKFVGDPRPTMTLDALLAGVLRQIERGVRASHGAVILGENGNSELVRWSNIGEEEVRGWQRSWTPDRRTALDCERADPVFPVRMRLRDDGGGGGTIGWIVLGPRPDGSACGKSERQALVELIAPIARAVRTLRERESRIAKQRALREVMDRRIAAQASQLDILGPRPA